MGFTGLARWVNAPPTGLELVKQNITSNHGGIDRGKWFLSIRSYRSIFNSIRGSQLANTDRNMCALTMNNSVFVLLEDPMAPTRAEFLHAQSQVREASDSSAQMPVHHGQISDPPHYRHTFVTVGPPGALEQLLAQLRARWLSTRQATAPSGRSQSQTVSQQLVIDGNIFSIGPDWLLRVGNVVLPGGVIKGMLLEAEYLPLPFIRLQAADETSEMLSNLLTSILPNVPNARTVAVTISEAQWDEVLWKRDELGVDSKVVNQVDSHKVGNVGSGDSDIMFYESDMIHDTSSSKTDWVGLDRDKRSAYLIIGALKSEGIL